MSRQPKIVKTADGMWNATTTSPEKLGGYWLSRVDIKWRRYENSYFFGMGSFVTKSEAIEALAKASLPPPDAVWDEDCETVDQPATDTNNVFYRHGFADALDRGLYASGKPSQAGPLAEYRRGFAAGEQSMLKCPEYLPSAQPAPAVAELERAVVEAVDAMKRHGVYAKGSLEDVLITRHDAYLAARENAAKGGGNQRGDAAGVK